jgi:hypothetical protein
MEERASDRVRMLESSAKNREKDLEESYIKKINELNA